jgi:uncharacterized protein YukJ
MPLTHYGVLVGDLQGHFRDQPDTQGKWYHVNLQVTAPAGLYRCAVDVDSKKSEVGVQWKRLTLPSSVIAPVNGLAPGYHELAHQPGSGALDFIRQPAFAGGPGCFFVRMPEAWLQRLLDLINASRRWISGSNLEAAQAFEPILVAGRRTYVFGEPFKTDLGMHNIHQNQGDPAGSQWWAENGIWQDGGTMTLRADGMLDVFISKFSTQATNTDAAGHPI